MAKSILYIEPNRAFFYTPTLTQPIGFNFTTESVQDGELVSREKLTSLIDVFLTNNKLPPGQIDFVLSTLLTFEKVLTTPQHTEQKDALQAFLEIVPYENVASLTASIRDQRWVIATNKSLLDNFKAIFEQHKWIVGIAVPLSVLQQVIPELQQQLDLPFLLSKVDMAKQYTFFNSQNTPRSLSSSQMPHPLITKDKPNKRNIILLSSVFSVLFVILVIMVINSMNPRPTSSLLMTPTPAPIIVRPSLIPTSGTQSASLTPSHIINPPVTPR